jgi:hypothetical protein
MSMTTADYALITSIASIFISILAFVWNILQKFIYVKPQLQVSFRVARVYQPREDTDQWISPTDLKLLSMTVTNMGPGASKLYACIVRTREHWWSKARYGMVNPIHGDPTVEDPPSLGPFSAGLPGKIEESDFKVINFPYNKDCLLKEHFVRVGINDTYQRNIWCSRRDVYHARKAYQRDFPHPVNL